MLKKQEEQYNTNHRTNAKRQKKHNNDVNTPPKNTRTQKTSNRQKHKQKVANNPFTTQK